MNAQTVIGPDTVVPGSAQVAPAFFLIVAIVMVVSTVVAVLVRRRRNQRRMPDERPRPVGVALAAAGIVAALVMVVVTWPPSFFVPEFPALPRLFPDKAFLYSDISGLPVAERSANWVESQGDLQIDAGWGNSVVDGVVFGVPFNPVDESTPRQNVPIRLYPDTSFEGEYPIADPAYIESMPSYGIDNHYVAVDTEAGWMWELWMARSWFGNWDADSGARWNLNELEFPVGSTIAAGLPLLAGSVTYEEVAAGRIDHVIYATTPTTRAGEWIWPARATDGRSDDASAAPQGTWFRLRSDVDLSGLTPGARVIAEAMQVHGVVLTDTSPNFALRGVPDRRWDSADLTSLSTLRTSDLEAVDASSLMVSPGSMEAKGDG